MRLAAFIRENKKPIISEWENFARTLTPASDSSSPLALRDHIDSILDFIVDDIPSAQTHSEQKAKSQGKKPALVKNSGAEIHASLRLAGGFSMNQMVSEYRALRASVITLWEAQLKTKTSADFTDLTRFHESIDQQLTESIHHYTRKLDHSRNLFLGTLSHDLRSPIGAAKMCAKLSLEMGSLQERETMLVTQVVESMDRAVAIIDYLLDLARARFGSGLPVIRSSMDMGYVSKVVVNEMRMLHPDRTFNLNISGDTQGEWDKPRIGQVFSNLIGNAVQYSFKESPINVTVRAGENDVAVSVHNEGVPIPPDTIGRIFDSLIREEKRESNDSKSINLGLGLYITKEIVAAHGGTIEVTSSEKSGTTFTARFPRSVRSYLDPVHVMPQAGMLKLVNH